MRGALHIILLNPILDRIIPADAGSTNRVYIMPDFCRGSSPRMRGALSLDDDMDRVAGIIPADAGSTGTMTRPGRCGRDHPRGCGEHSETVNG